MRRMHLGAAARARRRWVYAAAAAGAAGIAYWLLPFGDREALLRLVAAAPDGGFADEIRMPDAWADTTGLAAGAVIRVPLVLAIENVGGEEATPGRLELSVPTRYHMARNDGRPLLGQLAAGSPLVRYEVPVELPRVEPGGRPVPLEALDTLWLEPQIPAFYCVALADSVPDFVPAPPPPVEAIAQVQIFYSFDGGDLDRRQTGLLMVWLDPTLLKREAPEPPPVYPASYREPEAPMPGLGALRYAGNRRAFCGEPELPLELLSTLWETPPGGRFFVIDHGGVPRKYLFDLDRDSIIELEMWDPDGDGDFEARRAARLPIPAFLMPPPAAPQRDYASLLASIREDSLGLYDRYGPILAEPYEPRTAPPDTTRRPGRFRPLVLGGDDDEAARRGDRTWWPVDPSGPRLLGEPARAPDRPRRTDPAADPARAPSGGQARPPLVTPAPADSAGEPAAPATGKPAEPKPTRPEPKLLGRPVDSIPPPVRRRRNGARR